jgi:hypothetical protein
MWCKKKSGEKIVSCIIKFEEKHFFVQQKGMEKEATCDSVVGEQAIILIHRYLLLVFDFAV